MMAEEWTTSAIVERLHLEMCSYDEKQAPLESRKYYLQAIKYANRRAIVKQVQDFKDVFMIFIENFSPELREQILKLDSDTIDGVITDAVRKIIKSRAGRVYYEYLQNEPLRWSLLDGDGNGKGDGSVIAECVTNTEANESQEALTVLQRLAKRLMNENHFETMRDNEELYWYNGSGLYLDHQEWRIKEFCQINHPKIKTHEVQEVINSIKRSTFIDRDEFDSNPDIRNVTNGLLNLKTRELEPHRADYLSLVQLPVEYKRKAECKEIIRFLKDILNHEDIGTIIRLIGYLLLPTYEYDVVVMLFGKGANGKSTLLRLIEAFLGAINCSHRSLQQIDQDRFAVASLFGKLANLFADLKSTRVSETGYFKMLSGGDPIPAEFKFKDAFYFRNKAKLWFSANEIPESDDKTDAYYRRWRIFHFDKQFLKGKDDPQLIDKLTTPEELSGLLNMALTGLSRLQRDGGFNDKDIDEIRHDYEIHTNDVNAFLYEKCIVDISNADYMTLVSDLYSKYVTFCVNRGTRSVELNEFGRRLSKKGILNHRHKEYGESNHYYDGVVLRNTDEGQEVLQ